MQGEACFSVSYLVVTRSVVGCSNLVASIRCERGGDTQGEACFGVSYLAVTQSVLVVRCNLVLLLLDVSAVAIRKRRSLRRG